MSSIIAAACLVFAFSGLYFGQISAAKNESRIKRLDGSRISAVEIDRTVERLVEEAQVTGLNVAVIDDSKVVYLKSFGWRNK